MRDAQTITLELSGAATETDDYTVSGKTPTLGAGADSVTATVTAEQDSLVEGSETVEIKAKLVTVTSAAQTLTITDDDALTVSVAGPAANVEEGQTATFTVTVTGTSTAAVEVTYAVDTAESTADSGDYAAPGDTVLTIGAGVTSGTIDVVTTEDSVLEPDETLVLKLTAASTAGEANLSQTAASATATIKDTGTVTVSVEDEDAQADEGEPVPFVVKLSGEVSSEVQVSYATSHDTAGSADYTAVPATTLTFTAGQTEKTVTVTTTEDALNEANETFTVTLTKPGGVTWPDGVSLSEDKDEATGRIEDDDALTVSVAGPAANVEEGQTATFTVTVTGTSTAAVEVTYAVDTAESTADSGDYAAPGDTVLTIGAGVTSGTIDVVTTEDSVLEPDETLVLKLTAASTAGEANLSQTAASATATIKDTGTVTVSVEDEDAQADEGEPVPFVVKLSGEVSSEVQVSYATSHDTAGSADYTAVPATTLTFTAGQTEKTVTVTTTEDALNEANETFTVTLTKPGGVTWPDGVSLSEDKDEATGTIKDDDVLAAAVSRAAATVAEGEWAKSPVTLTGGTSTADVVVLYAVAGTATSGTDYTAPSGELTITTPATSGTISIKTLDDGVLDRGETLQVSLSSASTDTRTVTVDTNTAVETEIADSGTVTVRVDDAEADEGDPVNFEVELTGSVASVVEVSYATSHGGDAGDASTSDYTAANGRLTFSPGEALTQTFTVATTEDTLDEPDVKFTVTLTVPSGVTLPDGVTVQATGAKGTITDDDDPPELSIEDATAVTEGASASFEVSMDASGKQVEVSYQTEDDTAEEPGDYTSTSGTLTFAAGDTEKTITVATVNDTVDEADGETFTVKLSSPVNATLASDGTTATGTINDNDATVSVEAVTVEDNPNTQDVDEYDDKSVVDEGQSAMFEVVLSRAVANTVKVPFETGDQADSAEAGAGKDYTAASGTLTFAAHETSKTIAVETLEDDLNEANEIFTLKIGAPDPAVTGVTLGTASSETGTIVDTDGLSVSITEHTESVNEGETATLTVSLSEGSQSTAQVVVNYEVVAGDPTPPDEATPDEDYTAPSGVLTIATGVASGTISIVTLDDDIVESAQKVTIALESATSDGRTVAVDKTEKEITIVDTTGGDFFRDASESGVVGNSAGVQVSATMLRSASSVESGQDVTVDHRNTVETCAFPCLPEGGPRFEDIWRLKDKDGDLVTLEGDQTMEVSYATSGGTATGDVDYVALSATLTLTAGNTALTVHYEPIDDNIQEEDETFNFRIEPAERPDGTMTKRTGADLTIRDDDTLAEADSGPTVAFRSPASFPATGSFTVNIVFSEDVTGFGLGDIRVTNGSAGSFSGAADNDTYRVVVTPRDEFHGHVTVTVPAGAAVATADNTKGNIAGSKSFSVNTTTSTATLPTVTIESWDDFPADGPFDVTIGFSETVSGFALSDIAVTNGTAANFTGTDATYSVEITPAGNFAGNVTVTVPASSAFDADKNGNLPGSATFAVDTTPKLVDVDVSFGAAAYTATEEGSPATVTVVLNADPERTVVIPITARNGKGASDADYSGVPEQVTFVSGQTSQTFTVTATSDVDVDAGETVTLGFGDLPERSPR